MDPTSPNDTPMYKIRNEARKRLGTEEWRKRNQKLFKWRAAGRNHEWRYRTHPAESTVPEGLYVGFEAVGGEAEDGEE